ncbi:DoxX family protein [Actinoallomurus rhizosphaericola]|uniref:DoxX family protein n=1 Tax=Actinoallomurus rhizosphaericola TaxID=2952536 RepID=UPI0027E3A114|nr:DoxX family protein [Actinoallomurus rhizosphaericola]
METSPEDMNAFWTEEREERVVAPRRPVFDAVALLARCGVGVVFLAHGWQKIQVGVTATGHQFDAMGVPAPTAAAVYATFVELLGGAALILGVALPVAGTLLFLDMAGAFAFVHAAHGVFLVDKGTARNGFELVLVLGLASLLFAAGGGGRLTLDHRLFRRGGHGRPPGHRRRRRPDETRPGEVRSDETRPVETRPEGTPPPAPPAGEATRSQTPAPASPAPETAAGGTPEPPAEETPPSRPRRAATRTSRDVRVAGPKRDREPPVDGAPPAKAPPRARQARPRKGPSAEGS